MRRENVIEKKYACEIVYTCDWCGKEISYDFFHPKPCLVCERHACKNCNPCWHIEDDGSDYQDHYCEECWKIGEPYRETIERLESDIDNAKASWYALAREKAKEK